MRAKATFVAMGAGILLFLVGFGIGSTQGDGPNTLNSVAAVVGTVGVAIALIAVVIEIGRRLRGGAVED